MTLISMGVAASVAAQSTSGNEWARGTELGVFAGAASGSSDTGVVAGGTVGWEVTRWFVLEGRGSWFDRGPGADAFGADFGALVNVVSRRRVTPFFGAAFGLYRASFDGPSSRMSGFYRSRMMGGAGPTVAGRTSFTDPALRLTGGVDAIAVRHLSVRPEASVLLVHRDAQTEALITFGLRVGFRFEDRVVTP